MEESVVVALGETMVALVRDAASRAYLPSPAGAESNVAVGLARLGHRARWCGHLGADELGDLIVAELSAEGVELDVERDSGRLTGIMLKELDPPRATTVRYYRMGSAAAWPQRFDADRLEGAGWLHVTAITAALSEECRQWLQTAITMATAEGVRVSFDVNVRTRLWNDLDDLRSTTLELASQADLVFAGEDEIEVLIGDTSADRFAETIRLDGARQLIVKCGERGVRYLDAQGQHWQPALPVPVRELTGAGDALAAGYLAGLLRGLAVPERLRLGTLIASKAVQGYDDFGPPVTSDEVEAVTSGALSASTPDGEPTGTRTL